MIPPFNPLQEIQNLTGMIASQAIELDSVKNNEFYNLLLQAIPLIQNWEETPDFFDAKKVMNCYGIQGAHIDKHYSICNFNLMGYYKIKVYDSVFILYKPVSYEPPESNSALGTIMETHYIDDKKAYNSMKKKMKTFYQNIKKMSFGSQNYCIMSFPYRNGNTDVILFKDGYAYCNNYSASNEYYNLENEFISQIKRINGSKG